MPRKKLIRDYIVENFLFGEAGGLTTSQSLLGTGVLDSTGVMELIAHIEATFHIGVADTEVVPANLDSIDAIAAFVARKQATAGVGSSPTP